MSMEVVSRRIVRREQGSCLADGYSL